MLDMSQVLVILGENNNKYWITTKTIYNNSNTEKLALQPDHLRDHFNTCYIIYDCLCYLFVFAYFLISVLLFNKNGYE